MNNIYINIAISGLGLSTADDLKMRLRKILPTDIGINWTSVADQNLNCILISEQFFENDNIQRIIHNKKIPYLKISKHTEHTESAEDNILCVPIDNELTLKNWVKIKLLNSRQQSNVDTPSLVPEPESEPKTIDFFNNIYNHDSRKVILQDRLGTLAIVDYYAHFAWIEKTREEYQTDLSLHYAAATTTDFVKVSRKRQLNLENWLFNLIWKNPDLITLPAPNLHFRLNFWVQPNLEDKKVLLQLNACFIRGAEIQQVADKLQLPVTKVQYFIACNLAIQNAELISAKESQFNKPKATEQSTENKGIIKSFFGKLKSRFKF